MSKKNLKKVYEVRFSNWQYAVEIIRTMFSFCFFKHVFMLIAFYIFNCVRGRRLAHIGKECHISPTAVFRGPERIYIGDYCIVNHNNVFQSGKQSAVIRLGDYVVLGPNVQMFAYNHCRDLCGLPIIKQPYTDDDIIIEDDVCIGAGTIITAGATIGKGTFIGAGSVVVGHLPSNAVCVGVPARVIKFRE